MRKICIYILLILHVFFTGNIGIVVDNYFSVASAASTTWDFSTPGDYTLSDSNSVSARNGIGDLNLILEQVGSLANDNTTAFLDTPRRVSVLGDYAYISSFTPDRIQVIDISDVTNPTPVANLQDNGTTLMLNGPMASIINGNYLYIAEFQGDAIQIIDISDPTNPVAAGNIPNTGGIRLNGPRGLDIQGDFLYVASFADDAIQIFDISTPTSLVDVGEIDTANGRLNGARDIIVEGDYAYVSARNDSSVQIIDISTPASPTFVSQLIDNGTTIFLDRVWGLAKSGDYLYTTGFQQDRIQVVDVSTPASPIVVATLSPTELPSLDGPREMIIDGNFLYIANLVGDSVIVVDITDPTNPLFESEIVNSAASNLNGPRDLVKVGNNIHLVSHNDDDFVSLETSYSSTSPFITPNTALNYTGENLSSFTEVLGAGNQGNTSYQISKDNGTTWYYFDGSVWQSTINTAIDSNSASIINTNIGTFNTIPGGSDQFIWKAFLNSDGNQKVEIDNIEATSVAPGPGGVGTNLELWLKADTGTSTSTDGNTLATWNDQSGNGFDATAVVAPIYRNNTTDSLNFNPVIDFNGTTQYMRNLANGAHTDSYFMVIVPDDTVDGTLAGGVPFGFDCLSGTLSSGACGLSFAGTVLGAFTAAIGDEVITHALGSSANWRSAQTGIASYDSGSPMLIVVNENSGVNGTDIYEKGLQVNDTTTNTYQTLSNADYSIGRSLDGANPFQYDGKIAEVINYSGRVSDSERNNIESYLSLKYGMTLNNGTQNYIASDGSSSMWSVSTAGIYNNNIFGIGRDDTTFLGQIKSKSVNNDSIITLEALGEGTNIAPSFVDIQDREFLTISHNGAGNTWTATDAPATYNILSRKWKVQETGDVGTISLDFDIEDSDFNIPTLTAGTNYFFLYDTDGDGNLNDETPTSMSNVGDIWSISGINISHNRHFTIATLSSSNNIPTNITLSNDNLNENVPNGTTVGTLSTTDADGGDTHTYSFVAGTGDDNNSSFSLAGNILSLNYSPDYEINNSFLLRVQTNDGNGGTFQKQLIVSINDLGEALTTEIDFENISDEGKYTITSGSWSRTTNNPQEGSFALESDNLGINNTQSCFEISHTFTSTGTVDFQYNVSSQNGSDFLRFYIDDVEDQAWTGNVPYTSFTSTDITPGTHNYKWCYIKDGGGSAGTDNAFIDYITFPNTSGDITAPTISSTNFASGSLLPGGNHTIVINYSDLESGINTSSDSVTLHKWNGSIWGADISATGFNLGSKVITATSATYPTNNLSFGKYRYNFTIADNDGNTSTALLHVFYIDIPEFIISSGSIDIGNVHHLSNTFSPSVTVTVKTVGAAFNVHMNRSSNLTEGTENIPSWDGFEGYGYDQSPFSSTISTIGTDESLASQGAIINTDGNKNTYTYDIQIGALIDEFQASGNYLGNLDFGINFNY